MPEVEMNSSVSIYTSKTDFMAKSLRLHLLVGSLVLTNQYQATFNFLLITKSKMAMAVTTFDTRKRG